MSFLTIDPVTGEPMYAVSSEDLDVSPDGITWFHLLGSSCRHGLKLGMPPGA
jgi:hypothetical protein